MFLPAPMTELSIDCTSAMSELLVFRVGAIAVVAIQVRCRAVSPGDGRVLAGLRQIVAGELDARRWIDAGGELGDPLIDADTRLRQRHRPAAHVGEIDR